MKKFILTAIGFTALNAVAQFPSQKQDSLLNPHRTDTVDFRDPSFRRDVSKKDTSRSRELEGTKRDSFVPLDDRKPPKPPKD